MPKEMKMYMVNVHTQDILSDQHEQKLYIVQPESVGLIMECLQGLEKLGRARSITMEQIEAMTELGQIFGGYQDDPTNPEAPKT